ncbi:MAG: hypothetical protein WC421_10160 [Elusimicrobiales bacterium]
MKPGIAVIVLLSNALFMSACAEPAVQNGALATIAEAAPPETAKPEHAAPAADPVSPEQSPASAGAPAYSAALSADAGTKTAKTETAPPSGQPENAPAADVKISSPAAQPEAGAPSAVPAADNTVAVSSVPPQPAAEAACPPVAELAAKAAAADAENDFFPAYNFMKKGIECGYPSSPDFRYGSAARYAVMLGKYREAVRLAEQDGKALGARALSEYFKGDLRSAAASAREALKNEPSNIQALITLGLAKADVGETEAALAILPNDGKFGTMSRAYALACAGKTYPAVDAYSGVDIVIRSLEYPPVEEIKSRIAKMTDKDRADAASDAVKLEEKKNYRGVLLTLALLSRMPALSSEELRARNAMFDFARKHPEAAPLSRKAAALYATADEKIKAGDYKAALPLLRRTHMLALWDAKVIREYAIALARTGDIVRARMQADIYAAASGDETAASALKKEIAGIETQSKSAK